MRRLIWTRRPGRRSGNPNFKGQVSFIANGGFTPAFGPDKLHVEAIQTEGKATYPAVVRWRSQP